MTWVSSLKAWARGVKRDVVALYFAARDPRVPWYAKAVAAAVAAYALSPIDPIPDFIPVLGHVDELVVLPLGIMLASPDYSRGSRPRRQAHRQAPAVTGGTACPGRAPSPLVNNPGYKADPTGGHGGTPRGRNRG